MAAGRGWGVRQTLRGDLIIIRVKKKALAAVRLYLQTLLSSHLWPNEITPSIGSRARNPMIIFHPAGSECDQIAWNDEK